MYKIEINQSTKNNASSIRLIQSMFRPEWYYYAAFNNNLLMWTRPVARLLRLGASETSRGASVIKVPVPILTIKLC